MSGEKTQSWKSEYGFVWSVLGSVVGFANVLSFSAQCYKNGGGAFLIPYFIAYILLGIPMLYLEALVGQKTRNPFVTASGQYGQRIGRFFGWQSTFACLTIGAIYIVLIGYACFYAYFGLTSQIPSDTATFFSKDFLKTTSSIGELGPFSWGIFGMVLTIAIFTWWTLTRNIAEGVERICSLIMPLLGVFVILFALLSSFLPGAMAGIYAFLRPDLSRITDVALWRDVFGQLFFSLSLGLGIITGYARYNKKDFQLKRSMSMVAIGDFLISFISGWVIFACIGFMSHTQGLPFAEIIKTNSAFEIGFIIFPKILQIFSPIAQPILSLIFFLCIFIAGITGLFSIAESVCGNLESEFSLSRKKAVSISICTIAVMAICFCMGNASHVIGSIQPMVLGVNMILCAIAELIIFLYLSKAFIDDPIWYKGKRKKLSFYSLKYLVPLILMITLLAEIFKELDEGGIGLIVRWTWFVLAAASSLMLSRRQSGSLARRTDSAVTANS